MKSYDYFSAFDSWINNNKLYHNKNLRFVLGKEIAMWKQTNLGYLRVDRLLGCRLRRLASDGDPSLLDSVLDSTPRENTSEINFLSTFLETCNEQI